MKSVSLPGVSGLIMGGGGGGGEKDPRARTIAEAKGESLRLIMFGIRINFIGPVIVMPCVFYILAMKSLAPA